MHLPLTVTLSVLHVYLPFPLNFFFFSLLIYLKGEAKEGENLKLPIECGAPHGAQYGARHEAQSHDPKITTSAKTKSGMPT